MGTSGLSRVAIVTGAGSGIGRAVAEQLLAAGDAVVAVDLDGAALSWIDGVDLAATVVGDVAEVETNVQMVEVALDAFGGVDVVVLNAGIAPIGALAALSPDVIDRVLAVNLRSVALGIWASLPALERTMRPAIVTVGSISGMFGEPAMALYSASKAGVVNLTRSAAVELGPRGIRVNCVCPGPTMTGLADALIATHPSMPATLSASTPLKRLAEPEEVAAVICFLASANASFVHGAVVPVDGGITANVGQLPPPDPPRHQTREVTHA
jgi:NAD(P)-dependent dehydrogenase (short-subunit alcohol dehydrogenase family)